MASLACPVKLNLNLNMSSSSLVPSPGRCAGPSSSRGPAAAPWLQVAETCVLWESFKFWCCYLIIRHCCHLPCHSPCAVAGIQLVVFHNPCNAWISRVKFFSNEKLQRENSSGLFGIYKVIHRTQISKEISLFRFHRNSDRVLKTKIYNLKRDSEMANVSHSMPGDQDSNDSVSQIPAELLNCHCGLGLPPARALEPPVPVQCCHIEVAPDCVRNIPEHLKEYGVGHKIY